MSNEIIQTWNETVGLPELLLSVGEDLDREGLIGTPDRMRRAYQEFFRGYSENIEDIFKSTFEAEGGGVQVCQDISFTSVCEHHVVPFFGYVDIAYEAQERVLGLSKLARLVDYFACRLQIQERLTNEIADALFDELAPRGVLVTIQAIHLCCKGRGVRRDKMNFLTTANRGEVDLISKVYQFKRRDF